VAKQKQKKKHKEPQDPTSLNTYAKYSGMAFQMLAIILIFFWAGRKLDKLTGGETPIYTAILSLLGVIASLYVTLKDFIPRKK